MRAKICDVFALLFVLTFSACTQLLQPKSVDFSSLRQLSDDDSARLRIGLNRQSAEILSYRASFEGTLNHDLGSQRYRQVMVFERPDRMRVEFFATELNRLMILVNADKGFLKASDMEKRAAYFGRATAANVEQLLSVPLLPQDLMLWFLGQIEIRPGTGRVFELFHGTSSGKFLIRERRFDGTEVLHHIRESKTKDSVLRYLLESTEIRDSSGKLLFAATLDYASDSDLYPTEVSFSQYERGAKGRFVHQDLKLNPNLDKVREKIFQLEAPNGFTIYDLDGGADGNVEEQSGETSQPNPAETKKSLQEKDLL